MPEMISPIIKEHQPKSRHIDIAKCPTPYASCKGVSKKTKHDNAPQKHSAHHIMS